MADQIIENGLEINYQEVWGVEATCYIVVEVCWSCRFNWVYEGQETILDFKQSNKPRKDEWNEDSIIYSLELIHFAHNKAYGTNIDQGCNFTLY